ncbi:phage tail protein [Aeromonas enteropelogenes]|uniref:phage tail-collar fiber domain-containing protein n=1 Tax=Aeromonas enteropelogenes TaxID=29489 RepID=UPI003BA2B218
MSQIITAAFAHYWQQCLTDGQPVVLDEFVLANIPDLDPDADIDPGITLPPDTQIVHRQAVDQVGTVNLDTVAYSIVMDTSVGDFSFNAMYLINAAAGVMAMVVHKRSEEKWHTDESTGQLGNSVVKTMLMEYDRASEATATHVDASTWQIDYAARLRGLDEDMRLQARQFFGPATFYGEGFLLTEADGNYSVQPGLAYVGGLRVSLGEATSVAPTAGALWLDVYRAGSLLSAWENHAALVFADELVDFVDEAGYQHYVAKIADIAADNSVADARRVPSLTVTGDAEGQAVLAGDGMVIEVSIPGKLAQADYQPRPDSLRGDVPTIQNKDMDTCLPGEFGLYETSSCAHSPAGAGNWFYCETKSINADGSLIQLAWPYAGVGVLAWRNWRKSTEDWDDNWREAYDSGNKPTLGDIGGVPPVGAVLFFEDSALNPAVIYPGTTWARIAANQNIRGAVEGEAGGLTGGSDSAALGVEHMPPHAHTVNDHVHYVPPHAHYLFNSGYSNYGAPLNNAPSGPVADGGISRSTSDRDDYLLMASVGGNWVGVSSSAGETNTGGAAPATNVQGAGAAFSVLNAFYKLHIWKRLS